jgi:predicted O-methyltransferase YrrM
MKSISREQYEAAFERERRNDYPWVDDLEARYGFALSRERLERAARVLACPVKVNPPNWQHGRVLYAVARRLLTRVDGPALFLDIGTAKGFSALCLQWALDDAEADGRVVSVDVLDPSLRERRNTVVEVDSLRTLGEILKPWPEAAMIEFQCSTGVRWLETHGDRVHLAFVDGKHSFDAVAQEAMLLNKRQKPGDVIVFDDAHIPAVSNGIATLTGYYFEVLSVLPNRAYSIAVRH